MSRKKKSDAPMPATGAGLIRFYSEADSPGIKVKAYVTVVFSLLLLVIIMALHFFFPRIATTATT